jgi:flavin-dependent dehydrogenase
VKSAVVIGAGPAGCCAAVLLARLGVRVTLIEKKAFPRVKVCGEFVSPAGTEALERVVSPGQLVEAGARRVSLMALERGDRAVEWEHAPPGVVPESARAG